MRFYDINPGDNQWVLGPRKLSPSECTPQYPLYGYSTWAYSMCGRMGANPPPAIFEIIGKGAVVEFNLTVDGAPVISAKCAGLLRALLDEETAEFFPADVQGAKGEWKVINILDRVDCLDHQKSLVRYHDENHPRKPGKPRSVERLVIDPNRADGHDLFRLADWEVVIIASQRIKQALEEAEITGIEFWPVC